MVWESIGVEHFTTNWTNAYSTSYSNELQIRMKLNDENKLIK